MSIEGLAEPGEVPEPEPPRRALPKLIAALLALGVALGLIAGVALTVGTGFAQTEAGLCRITVFDCTGLSAATVSRLSALELPTGSEVPEGFASEEGEVTTFTATVRLPSGAVNPLATSYERVADSAALSPQLVDRAAALGLDDLGFWSGALATGVVDAVSGRDGEGRTVLLLASVAR